MREFFRSKVHKCVSKWENSNKKIVTNRGVSIHWSSKYLSVPFLSIEIFLSHLYLLNLTKWQLAVSGGAFYCPLGTGGVSRYYCDNRVERSRANSPDGGPRHAAQSLLKSQGGGGATPLGQTAKVLWENRRFDHNVSIYCTLSHIHIPAISHFLWVSGSNQSLRGKRHRNRTMVKG